MNLLSVYFRNFCQFKELLINFHPGLNCIIGESGCGKTSAVDGIYAAISNDFTRFTSKSACISQYAANTEPSYIELDFKHNQSQCSLYRGLRPDSKQLQIDKNTALKSEKDISAALEDLLAVNKRILSEYVFVGQYDLFNFLLSTTSERIKSFNRLFGVEAAESAWKAIGEASAALSIPLITIDMDVVRNRIKEYKATAVELSKTYWDAKEKYERYDKHCAKWHKIVNNYNDMELSREALVRYERRVKELNAQVEPIRVSIRDIEIELQAIDHDLESDFANYCLAEKCAKQWPEYKQYLKSVNKWKEYREEIDQKAKALKKPTLSTPDITYLYIDEKKEELASIKARASLLNKQIRNIESGTHTECPECGTSVNALKESLNSKKYYLAVCMQEVEKLQKKIDDYDRYNKEWEIFHKKQDSLDSRRTDAEEKLQELLEGSEKVKQPDLDEHTTRLWLAGRAAETATKTTYLADLNKLQLKLASAVGELNSCNQAITIINSKLSEFNIDKTAAATAEKRLAQHSELLNKVKLYRERILDIKKLLEQDQKVLKEAETNYKKAESTRQVQGLLDTMRSILFREALPKTITEKKLAKLVDKTNEMLESFNSNFWIRALDDLSFEAHFQDGRVLPATALSGGERSILAIAFRIVVNSTYANDLGLLCLDEPTARLSERNLKCLTVALDKLKQLSKSNGLQCIIITHQKSLIPHFDRVIEL
jgi:DNA repair exonuclease SbcCD ATPase subunit